MGFPSLGLRVVGRRLRLLYGCGQFRVEMKPLTMDPQVFEPIVPPQILVDAPSYHFQDTQLERACDLQLLQPCVYGSCLSDFNAIRPHSFNKIDVCGPPRTVPSDLGSVIVLAVAPLALSPLNYVNWLAAGACVCHSAIVGN
jgi:hypothetical protein